MLTLVIGDKNLSSWSLRPWLVLQHFGFAVPRDQAAAGHAGVPRADRRSTRGAARARADRRRAAHLGLAGDRRVPEREGRRTRLAGRLRCCGRMRARSAPRCIRASLALRQTWSMHAIGSNPDVPLPPAGRERRRAHRGDLGRLPDDSTPRRGPWLFGEFSIADAMYAPVVLRFNHYGATLSTLRSVLQQAAGSAHAAVAAGREPDAASGLGATAAMSNESSSCKLPTAAVPLVRNAHVQGARTTYRRG